MPEPRRSMLKSAAIRVILEPATRDLAAAQRRTRAGKRIGRHGASAGMPVEVRNGLPFKPYVYRGLGYDQMEAAIDADDLAWCKENGWARDA